MRASLGIIFLTKFGFNQLRNAGDTSEQPQQRLVVMVCEWRRNSINIMGQGELEVWRTELGGVLGGGGGIAVSALYHQHRVWERYIQWDLV